MPKDYYTSADVFSARAKRKASSTNSNSDNKISELETYIKSKVPFILKQFEESIQKEFERMIKGNDNPFLDMKLDLNAYAYVPMISKRQMLEAVKLETHKLPELIEGVQGLCAIYGLEMDDKNNAYHGNPNSYKYLSRKGDNEHNKTECFDLAFICYLKMVPPSSPV